MSDMTSLLNDALDGTNQPEFGFDFGGEETLPTKPKPTINILFPNVDKENLPKKSYNMSLSKQLWDSETDSYAPLAVSNMPFPRLQPGPPAGGGGLLPAAGASTGAVIPTGLFGQGPPLAVGGQAHFGSLHRVAPAPPAAGIPHGSSVPLHNVAPDTWIAAHPTTGASIEFNQAQMDRAMAYATRTRINKQSDQMSQMLKMIEELKKECDTKVKALEKTIEENKKESEAEVTYLKDRVDKLEGKVSFWKGEHENKQMIAEDLKGAKAEGEKGTLQKDLKDAEEKLGEERKKRQREEETARALEKGKAKIEEENTKLKDNLQKTTMAERALCWHGHDDHGIKTHFANTCKCSMCDQCYKKLEETHEAKGGDDSIPMQCNCGALVSQWYIIDYGNDHQVSKRQKTG